MVTRRESRGLRLQYVASHSHRHPARGDGAFSRQQPRPCRCPARVAAFEHQPAVARVPAVPGDVAHRHRHGAAGLFLAGLVDAGHRRDRYRRHAPGCAKAGACFLLIVIATIPAVILGFALEKFFRNLFGSPMIAAGMLVC